MVALAALVLLVPRRPPPPPSPAQPDQAFIDDAGMVSAAFARSTAGGLLNDPFAQIVVFTTPRAPAGDLEAWTTQSATAWKVGSAQRDTGIVLFVFRDARVARLEVGYGLEGVLPDARVRQLLEAKLAPAFAQRAYEAGFDAFLGALREDLRGDAEVSTATAAAIAAQPSDLPWYRQIFTAYPRLPRMLLATWQRFREEGANARFAILLFVGAGFTIAGCGIFLAYATLRRMVLLPRDWRDTAGQPVVERIFDAKLEQLVAGPAGVVLCFAITGIAVIQAEDWITRTGHFGGAGAAIVWPAPPR